MTNFDHQMIFHTYIIYAMPSGVVIVTFWCDFSSWLYDSGIFEWTQWNFSCIFSFFHDFKNLLWIENEWSKSYHICPIEAAYMYVSIFVNEFDVNHLSFFFPYKGISNFVFFTCILFYFFLTLKCPHTIFLL